MNVSVSLANECSSQVKCVSAPGVDCSYSADAQMRQLPRYVPPSSGQPGKIPPHRYLFYVGGGLVAIFLLILFSQERQPGPATQTTAQTDDVRAIREVMQQDGDRSGAADTAIREIRVTGDAALDRIAELMRIYVASAQQIDTRACPHDFAQTYNQHLSAWLGQADPVSSHPAMSGSNQALVEGFFRGAPEGMTIGFSGQRDAFNVWREQINARSADMERTRNRMETLAVRYGAR